MKLFLSLILSLLLAACAGHAPRTGDILVLGDSVMAWNGSENDDIANVIANDLERSVSAGPVPGAMFTNPSRVAAAVGFDIRAQYPGGRWNWVVLNGGANDLALGDCGCGDCRAEVDSLIAQDAQGGAIPQFVDRILASGARVLWMGYYTAPGSSFVGCTDDFEVLETRIERYVDSRAGAYFFDGDTVIDKADASLFASDDTHPSPRGSALLGTALADVIRRQEDRSQKP
ncbi:SGNH/GDSL hydrolase family protein [Sulfitobacter sp. HNIBRBA3233]|uniref:SGNH/GDSL hydrolase family protein n=1 Tax=Sulfitobacter marinivivus TaxID=3158558 RepID=UPI0032DFF679